MEIEVTYWSYIVVISSIIIDVSRSRALSRVAKKHNSQALEADALHFSTDIWSSGVVLLGLICANFGWFFADSIAAMFVAIIVMWVSYKLGKKSIDVLLDRTPDGVFAKVERILQEVPEIQHFHDLRVRTSGADTFVEVNIHVNQGLTINEAHIISETLENKVLETIQRSHIHVHIEPDEIENI